MVVVDTTVNIVFCFGPRLGLKTEVWAQAEQYRPYMKGKGKQKVARMEKLVLRKLIGAPKLL